jgi:hypothetical protein
VGEQFEVTNEPLCHEVRDATLEKFTGDEIDTANAGAAVKCAAGRCIEGDDIMEVSKFQEGDAIPPAQVTAPPLDVKMKIIVEGDVGVCVRTAPQSGQHSGKLKAARADNSAHVEDLSGDGLQVAAISDEPMLPEVEECQESLELIWRNGDGIVLQIEKDTQTDERGRRRTNMTGSLAGLEPKTSNKVEKGIPQMRSETLWTDGNVVVHVWRHPVVTTTTRTRTPTVSTRIGDARSGRDLRPKDPGEAIGLPLGGEHGAPVAK